MTTRSADARSPGGTVASQAEREQQVTDHVVASFAGATSDRFRTVMEALVHSLHSFAREVRLTEAEWQAAIAFLTRCGEITDERRQEFILLSDVLGLSMLTVGINAGDDPRATESTVFGPFFVEGSPEVPIGGDVGAGAAGQPCWVEGQVTDLDGNPIAGALVEVWEADSEGFYDVQHDDRRSYGRAHLRTDEDGRYAFWCVRPAPYPIPDDGPVGDLLSAAGRGPMRPAHVHFLVEAPGYRRLVTHVFVAGDPYLGNDAVFGVKDSLIREFEVQPAGPAPGARVLDEPWCRFRFDIALAPDTDTDTDTAGTTEEA
jgi:hydroxyquinol 1,2-dioxygenase